MAAEWLSSLQPLSVAGGSKSLFVVTANGKVYACGEGSNGRLGLGHSNNVAQPRQITALSQHVIRKVAVHSGGRHALALTADGRVFSWGEGDDGKLGHGDCCTLETPRCIEALIGEPNVSSLVNGFFWSCFSYRISSLFVGLRIRDIAAGSNHSAAVTSCGELYKT